MCKISCNFIEIEQIASSLLESHNMTYDFFHHFTWNIHRNVMGMSKYLIKRHAQWTEFFVTSVYSFMLSICDSCMAVIPSSI